jgi:hypothetical protein
MLQMAFTGILPSCTACDSSEGCPGGQYCARLLGECETAGVCAPRPDDCSGLWKPVVCGCNGVTYTNGCQAALDGASVAHEGECPPTDCQVNSDCQPGDYCEKAIGDCDGTGECLLQPTYCIPQGVAVCGCDGESYPTAHCAHVEGVNVAHEGPCPPPPCQETSECEPDEYCEKTLGDCEGTGVCMSRPQTCYPTGPPVCGCDGVDYPSPCVAAKGGGVSVNHEGECPPPSCQTNDDCDERDRCAKDVGVCDRGPGVCEPLPDTCMPSGGPVCGCDGVTYRDWCEAVEAKVNLAAEEACRP